MKTTGIRATLSLFGVWLDPRFYCVKFWMSKMSKTIQNYHKRPKCPKINSLTKNEKKVLKWILNKTVFFFFRASGLIRKWDNVHMFPLFVIWWRPFEEISVNHRHFPELCFYIIYQLWPNISATHNLED